MLTESSNLSDRDDNDTLSIHLGAIDNLSLMDDNDDKRNNLIENDSLNNDDLDLRY